MSDRIITFPNGVIKDFGKRMSLVSDINVTGTVFSVDFYVSNGAYFQFTKDTACGEDFVVQAAAYGVEQRIKNATNLASTKRTPETICQIIQDTLASFNEEGWNTGRGAGKGTAAPSTYELAYLSVEGNTKESWEALGVDKRNVRKDPRVNKAFYELQAKSIKLPEAA